MPPFRRIGHGILRSAEAMNILWLKPSAERPRGYTEDDLRMHESPGRSFIKFFQFWTIDVLGR